MHKPRFIRLPDVITKTGLRRSTIYERMAEGTFPTAINLGGRSVAWIETEVDDWMLSQIEKSRLAGVR
ncbi:MAG: DNA-binding protein [Hyphomonadaceae bacterium]|nr:MAG: DNA-binding protein [Hyphomonadaceae bacterium]KAF0185972.1 MAG: DNA-binding protein [Hyphomonadaceae bacterium]